MDEPNDFPAAKVKSLRKAVKLLDYFTAETPERGITELANLSGLLKSSVSNIASTFETCGFLERNEETGRYRLGLKILQLSNNLYLSHDLRILIRPFMERVCQTADENVYLGTVSEDEVIYMDAVYPSATFTGRSIIGIKAPLYCTGIGKALMAYFDAAHINTLISKGLHAFTPNTKATASAFLADMEQTRLRGYAIDDMEHEYGVSCVAVPIRNIRGSVVAAMSVSGPQPRFTKERIEHYAQLLLGVTRELQGLIRR